MAYMLTVIISAAALTVIWHNNYITNDINSISYLTSTGNLIL